MKLISILRVLNIVIFASQKERINSTSLWNKIVNKGLIADKFDWLEVGE